MRANETLEKNYMKRGQIYRQIDIWTDIATKGPFFENRKIPLSRIFLELIINHFNLKSCSVWPPHKNRATI